MRNSKNEFRIDFIVIGVQKAGTSALYHYLRQHPEIAMGDIKELHFFDNDKYFENKYVDYNTYHKHFVLGEENKRHGEITPSYIYWNKSINRIQKYNPKIKLITILRNPIDRAYSHWNMSVIKNNESRPFLECIIDQIAQIISNIHNQNFPNSYIERGLYYKQIERVLSNFPRHQTLFIKYEDFLKEQEKCVNQLISFLGIESNNETFNFSIKQIFKIDYSQKMSNQERKVLQTFYREDIKKVEMILGMDLRDWLK